MRAGPSAGAAASRGGSGASPHRRCGSARTRERIQAPALPGFSHSMPGFRKNATPRPSPPPREEARGSGRVCTVSGRLRHDSARWPASMSQSAGFPALDAERLATVRRTRRVSDAECWVAVLQGYWVAGLQGCRVAGCWVARSLGCRVAGYRVAGLPGCEVAGLRGRWVQSCWVRGCGLRGSVLQDTAPQPKTKAGQKRFRC